MREESGQTSSQVLTRETIEGLSDAMSGEPAGVLPQGPAGSLRGRHARPASVSVATDPQAVGDDLP